jgi:hypothetical protein
MRLFFSDVGLEFTLDTLENILSCTPTSPSETFCRSVFPTPKMTLIREKTTLLFSEYSILLPIWLSKAESQLKMTANSTYWEAKLREAGWVARSTGKEPLFSRSIIPARNPGRPALHPPHFSVGDFLSQSVPNSQNDTNSRKNDTIVFGILHSIAHSAIGG